MLGQLFDALKARVRAGDLPIMSAIGRLGEKFDEGDTLPGQMRLTRALVAFYMVHFTAMACFDLAGYTGRAGGMAVVVSGLILVFLAIAYLGQPNGVLTQDEDEPASAELQEVVNALRADRAKLVAGRRRALDDLLIAHRELNVLRKAMADARYLFQHGEPSLLTPERIRRIVLEAQLASAEFALERARRAASRASKAGPEVPCRESSRPECRSPELSGWCEQILALKPGDACEFRDKDWHEWQPATVIENGGSSRWRVRLSDGTELDSVHPEQIKSPGGVDWGGE